MTAILSEIVSALLQVGVLALIPYRFYRFSRRNEGTFRGYFGFVGAPGISVVYGIAASVLFLSAGIGLAVFSQDFRALLWRLGFYHRAVDVAEETQRGSY